MKIKASSQHPKSIQQAVGKKYSNAFPQSFLLKLTSFFNAIR